MHCLTNWVWGASLGGDTGEGQRGEGSVFPPDDSQRKQYEEWLQETQQLLQMQQKYLEEQIGAHRKSKKALSAKQRTAKKAGREFPEEDAEQLKHVTEQQSMVQKQLEQVGSPAACGAAVCAPRDQARVVGASR